MQVEEQQLFSEQTSSGDDAEERLTRLSAAGVGDKSLGRFDQRPHRQSGVDQGTVGGTNSYSTISDDPHSPGVALVAPSTDQRGVQPPLRRNSAPMPARSATSYSASTSRLYAAGRSAAAPAQAPQDWEHHCSPQTASNQPAASLSSSSEETPPQPHEAPIGTVLVPRQRSARDRGTRHDISPRLSTAFLA